MEGKLREVLEEFIERCGNILMFFRCTYAIPSIQNDVVQNFLHTSS